MHGRKPSRYSLWAIVKLNGNDLKFAMFVCPGRIGSDNPDFKVLSWENNLDLICNVLWAIDAPCQARFSILAFSAADIRQLIVLNR